MCLQLFHNFDRHCTEYENSLISACDFQKAHAEFITHMRNLEKSHVEIKIHMREIIDLITYKNFRRDLTLFQPHVGFLGSACGFYLPHAE